MRLLLICDNPAEIGGVSNYTRPLFRELRNQGVDVTLLCTSSMLRRFHFFRRSGIHPLGEGVFEYYNCPILPTNYSHAANDLRHPRMEKEIRRFLDSGHFDVVHIHSMVGMPVSLYGLLKETGAKILTTAHEYWWLCPYRVMVDFNNRICDGPEDFTRCAYCTRRRGHVKDDRYRVFVLKFKNTFPRLHAALFRLYRKWKPIPPPSGVSSLEFGCDKVPAGFEPALADAWKTRLEACIAGLNLCDRVIGVSEDVRRILVKYGVDADRILVQHIGSAIAEKTIPHTRAVNPDDVVFGFIGGVGFYKGVHQLVKAYAGLPASLKVRSRLEIFGKYEQPYVDAITQSYLADESDRRRVTFHGRFSPEDIPGITNQIDISVLPSLCADTAPQTIFESFNAGLPIIAPRVGGFPDFVIDGENGLLYPAGDVDGLQACLAAILTDVSMIGRFRERIPRTKTMSENARELLALYEMLQ